MAQLGQDGVELLDLLGAERFALGADGDHELERHFWCDLPELLPGFGQVTQRSEAQLGFRRDARPARLRPQVKLGVSGCCARLLWQADFALGCRLKLSFRSFLEGQIAVFVRRTQEA